MSARHFLVTGGAGFVGSNLALELESRGDRVTVLDNFTSGHFKNLQGFHGDVITALSEDASWPDKLAAPPDAIFHLASITDTTVHDAARMMTNVDGFRVVLNLARQLSIPVVYASSAAVYGQAAPPMQEDGPSAPANIYGFSKRIMENLASVYRRRGVRSIGLRYFNVYGPGEDFKAAATSMVGQLARQILDGRNPRIFKHGGQGRDFIYIKDVVAATIHALGHTDLQVVNVGTGVETTFNEVIRHLNAGLGTDQQPEYFDNPYESFYQAHTRADVTRLNEGMQFRCKYTPAEGIAQYARALRG